MTETETVYQILETVALVAGMKKLTRNPCEHTSKNQDISHDKITALFEIMNRVINPTKRSNSNYVPLRMKQQKEILDQWQMHYCISNIPGRTIILEFGPQNKRKTLFSFEHHRVPFGGKPPIKFLSKASVPDKILGKGEFFF